MSGSRRSARAAALAGALLGALAGAVAAHGDFGAAASGGPLQVATATLATPAGPHAANGLCFPHLATTVVVTWDADGDAHAGRATVLRATSPAGPFAPIALQQPLVGRYVDLTDDFSTTLYYAVETSDGAWTSPASAAASVRTPSRDCRFF